MTTVTDHVCPNCNTTLGQMKKVNELVGVPDKEDDDDMYSVCIVCGTFLRVLAFIDGRAKVRILTDEEFMEMPDNQRITLKRAVRHTAGVNPKMIKEVMERNAATREKFDASDKALGVAIDKLLVDIFGDSMAFIILLKDLSPMGFQTMVGNVPEDMIVEVLRRALMEADGTMKNIMKEVLGGN